MSCSAASANCGPVRTGPHPGPLPVGEGAMGEESGGGAPSFGSRALQVWIEKPLR